MIHAVTLHPALDVTLWVNRLDPREPVHALRERVEPGGKGANEARVLSALGQAVTLHGFVGTDNGERFTAPLEEAGIRLRLRKIPGPVRENLTLVSGDGQVCKIDRQGFPVAPERLEPLERDLRADTAEGELVLFSGSLPPALPGGSLAALAARFRESGRRVVLDSDFLEEEDLRRIRPFAWKPNRPEFSRLAGKPLRSLAELAEEAAVRSGLAEHLLISLGADGILYAGGGRLLRVLVPQVEVKSPVGAGDSTLAGFLTALETGQSLEDSLRFAAACGTAAVLTEGTGVLRPDAVWALLPEIHLEE